MNKNTIFIPLLLLALQPNRMLGADNYQQAKAKIDKVLANWWSAHPHFLHEGAKYESENAEVRLLLDSCRTDMGEGRSDYLQECISIIKEHYPNAADELFIEQSGENIKG